MGPYGKLNFTGKAFDTEPLGEAIAALLHKYNYYTYFVQ